MLSVQVIEEKKSPKKLELADIFHRFGDDYCRNQKMPSSHHKVMHKVMVCRTSYLGGHLRKCDSCGYEHPVYNSCGNRHCPKCQGLARLRWVEKRGRELLPVNYFHNVFTLPHGLNSLASSNQKTIYDILFKSVSETLIQFGHNDLGGKIGFLAILHTWDQKLYRHIHLHFIIPAGALSDDRKRWISPPDDDFLFSVRSLSSVFKKKFLFYLKEAYEGGELTFAGKSSRFKDKERFKTLIDDLYQKDWVVYSARPFAEPKSVLDYLSRYTHRTAISNDRIKDVKDNTVTFVYRDRKDGNIKKDITISASEFIRRFFLHILPCSYMRIRHFGFLSNRDRKKNIACAKSLLRVSYDVSTEKEKSTRDLMLSITGKDILKCPNCKVGIMIRNLLIPGFSEWFERQFINPELVDSS